MAHRIPCPFCGSFDVHIKNQYYDTDMHEKRTEFKCTTCGEQWKEIVGPLH